MGKDDERIIPTDEPEDIIAEKMSDFYLNKVRLIREKIISEGVQSSDNISVASTAISSKENVVMSSFNEIDLDDLQKSMLGLSKKFCSLDPAPISVLSSCFDLLYPLILKIVNLSLSTGEFPSPLKHALITPILKNPSFDPETFSYYRPVSSLPFLSKVQEKFIHIQLTNYIEKNDLYPKFQSSYRKDHSCETALIRLVDDVQMHLSERKNVALILLDSSAAFDTVDQHILLQKLERNFGIKGNALNLIKSYFKNRTFSTKINKTQSKPRRLLHGVPQGSLLGPLLYVLYTYEIENIVLQHGLSILCYADDCQIYVPFDDSRKTETEKLIAECLNHLQSWMKTNFLKLNPEKTVVKIFKHKTSLVTDFTVNNTDLTTTGPIRVLGANISNAWKFNEFIAKKTQASNFHLRNLYDIRDSLDTSTRILLVTNLILSTIDYCNILLLGATDKDLKPLRLIINKSLRFIYNLRIREHITPFYKKSHFLPIKQRISFKASLTAFKIFNNKAPSYLCNDFKKYIPTYNMTLREGSGRDRYTYDIDSSLVRSRRLVILIMKEWNSLPLEIRRITSVSLFKNKLKTFLFSKF